MKTVDWEMVQVKALAEQIANIRTSAWIRSSYVKVGGLVRLLLVILPFGRRTQKIP